MADAKKAPAKKAAPKPAKPEVVVTVTGTHAVDGVSPGGVMRNKVELPRLRRLLRAGCVTVTVDGEQISDAHIVAKMEGA